MPILRGKVVDGLGDHAQWIEKLHEYYVAKTGLKLFPGTLNVELDQPYFLPPDRLRLEAHEYGGRVSINVVPCRIRGLSAYLLRTDGNESDHGDHPRTIIEIAAEVKLRDHFNLQNGDFVEVEMN